MITQEQLNLWTARLRDPSSVQATNVMQSLQDPSAKCCLEHACAILMPGWTQLTPGSSRASHYKFINKLIGNDAESALINLNDGLRKKLPEIADWIDANIIPTA